MAIEVVDPTATFLEAKKAEAEARGVLENRLQEIKGREEGRAREMERRGGPDSRAAPREEAVHEKAEARSRAEEGERVAWNRTRRLPALREVSRAERYGKTVKVVLGKPRKHGSYKFVPSKQTPPCTYCGAPAVWKLDIKVDWFRGNDERTRACADCYARIR